MTPPVYVGLDHQIKQGWTYYLFFTVYLRNTEGACPGEILNNI